MTTEAAIPGLEYYSESRGKTFYKPVTRRFKGPGQYRDTDCQFYGLEGFWNLGDNEPLTVGDWYTLALSTKPKTGPNAKPGSVYMDIAKVIPAKDEDIPQESPQEAQSNGGTGNGGNYNPRDDQPSAVALGMCQNNAVALICAGIVTVDEGVETLMGCIQGLRDQLYYEVTAQAYLDRPVSTPAPAPQEPVDDGLPF